MDFVSVRVITHGVERLAVELRVDDVDATWERVKGLVPQTVPEIVLVPTDMPWGNRSMILRDPDGGLVNLFTPVTPEAKAKYGL